MKIGIVIGRVTLNKTMPRLQGARWLLVSPCGQNEIQKQGGTTSGEPSLVVFDNLGGGTGDQIGFIEGREAAAPFDEPMPIDAINAALIDKIFYTPKP